MATHQPVTGHRRAEQEFAFQDLLHRKEEVEKRRQKQVDDLLKDIRKNEESSLNLYRKLAIAYHKLLSAQTNIELYAKKHEIRRLQDENFLNKARSNVSNAIVELEADLGTPIDATAEEMSEIRGKIPLFNPARVEALYQTILSSINLLVEAGKTREHWYSRTKWNLNELVGRATVIIRNMTDLTEAYKAEVNFSAAYRDEYIRLVRLLMENFEQVAQSSIEKYSFSESPEDIRNAIHYVDELRRLQDQMRDTKGAEKSKKLRDSWKARLENDLKKKDRKRK